MNVSMHSRPGIRAFKSFDVAGVLTTAARRGWWKLPRSALQELMEERGWSTEGYVTDFDVLHRLTKKVLHCTEEQCLTVLEHRLRQMTVACSWGQELLEVDEAAQCLREEDRSDVQAQIETSEALTTATNDLRKEFKERRASLRTTPGGKKSKDKFAWEGPVTLPPFDHVDQKVLRKFLTKDTTIQGEKKFMCCPYSIGQKLQYHYFSSYDTFQYPCLTL